MSAWLVWTMLGLYPLDPCGGAYEIGRPFLPRAQAHVLDQYERLRKDEGEGELGLALFNARALPTCTHHRYTSSVHIIGLFLIFELRMKICSSL